MVNITIGTPAQNLSLSLDIGSSDIWVNVPSSTYCAAEDDPCSSTGLFKSKDSSTFKKLDYDLNATYVGGFLAAGPYATDKLVIGAATVKDMEFALAEESKNPRKFDFFFLIMQFFNSKSDKKRKRHLANRGNFRTLYRWNFGNWICVSYLCRCESRQGIRQPPGGAGQKRCY